MDNSSHPDYGSRKLIDACKRHKFECNGAVFFRQHGDRQGRVEHCIHCGKSALRDVQNGRLLGR
jgi:hypothetical protein